MGRTSGWLYMSVTRMRSRSVVVSARPCWRVVSDPEYTARPLVLTWEALHETIDARVKGALVGAIYGTIVTRKKRDGGTDGTGSR